MQPPNRILVAAALMLQASWRADAQSDSTLRASAAGVSTHGDTVPVLKLGGFVDTYYAWDFDRPATFDRAYTTQPARHAEMNVNLAFVDLRLTAPRYRGRVALQYGTSVQANYASEPRIGVVSGPAVSQYIQEATIGFGLASATWLDAGIFLAHTGYESWISRDNLTYTRSLMAEYSPYYEAGVKLTWSPSPALTAQIDVVNGWQTISKYNTPPAAGIRIDYTPTHSLALSYDDFLGNMAPDSAPAQLRVFNEVAATLTPSSRWQLASVLDVGSQSRSTGRGGTATWYGAAAFARYHITPLVAAVTRVERYADASAVLVRTPTGVPFRTTGTSLGVDVSPEPRLLWRTELRGFRSGAAVWPRHMPGHFGRTDAFVVTSLALTL